MFNFINQFLCISNLYFCYIIQLFIAYSVKYCYTKCRNIFVFSIGTNHEVEDGKWTIGLHAMQY